MDYKIYLNVLSRGYNWLKCKWETRWRRQQVSDCSNIQYYTIIKLLSMLWALHYCDIIQVAWSNLSGTIVTILHWEVCCVNLNYLNKTPIYVENLFVHNLHCIYLFLGALYTVNIFVHIWYLDKTHITFPLDTILHIC